MFRTLQRWQERYLGDEQALVLVMLLVIAGLLVLWMGSILAPIFASMVLAYLLQGLVKVMKQLGMPKLVAVTGVTLLFLLVLVGTIFGLIPLLWQQLSRLAARDLPSMTEQVQNVILSLSEKFSGIFGEQLVRAWSDALNSQITEFSSAILSSSLDTLFNLVQLGVYLILVPLLVFFMLKDSPALLKWCTSFLPERRHILQQVWVELDRQLANYVRGKALEILIVGTVAYIIFAVLDLNYAVLLGLLVGLSVLVPYVGALVVTVPVLAVGYFQWGTGDTFLYLAVSYAILQTLDANMLVPLLFSEAVSLHPVAIILAVLVFGGLWGFWGIFFAIPLATLVKALLEAWPRTE